jgi:hypothetical protein
MNATTTYTITRTGGITVGGRTVVYPRHQQRQRPISGALDRFDPPGIK